MSVVVEQGANPAIAVAADDDVADVQGSLLDQHGRQHAPALGERGFQAGAGGRAVGIGLELVQFGDGLERGQQVGDSRPGDGRGLDDLDVAAPLHGVKALLRELAVNLVDVRGGVDVGQVDLVQGHDDRHLGGLGVGDGLDRLGHDAVVGGHDQDHDVRHVGAAGAHGGEGLVAGRVDEGDRLAVVLDLVGADVLGDAAALALDDLGLADAVQERGLAVIDVAQDGDDRRARHEVLRGGVRRRAIP